MRKLFAVALAGSILAAGAVIAVNAQTGGVLPADAVVPWWKALLAMSGVFLPVVGRVLAAVPFVPGRLIPAVNAVLAVLAKLGLFSLLPGQESASLLPGVDSAHLAGFPWQSIVGVVWGLGEQFLSQTLYENQKAKSRAALAMGMAAPLLAKVLVPKNKQRA